MNERSKAVEPPREESQFANEPGLTESLGSFPVWMLKAIDLLTPDFLIQKKKTKKESPGGPK